MEVREKTSVPMGRSGCSPPDVPRRRRVSLFSVLWMCRVLKSMLASASSSVMTISMLSVPMPVDITVSRLPLQVPVMVWNSRLETSLSRVSKWAATMATRPGSPTRMTVSARSSGRKWRWYTEPSSFTSSSEGGIVLIKDRVYFLVELKIVIFVEL